MCPVCGPSQREKSLDIAHSDEGERKLKIGKVEEEDRRNRRI